jgi:hypothetical protein
MIFGSSSIATYGTAKTDVGVSFQINGSRVGRANPALAGHPEAARKSVRTTGLAVAGKATNTVRTDARRIADVAALAAVVGVAAEKDASDRRTAIERWRAVAAPSVAPRGVLATQSR